ncbi:hypothetical protein [Pseudomonas sp. Z4-7]|uniref:hypothetical protein n=1 Tax=unclassified Pseudomonas TaxID=196821 RepID=UPI003DA99A04
MYSDVKTFIYGRGVTMAAREIRMSFEDFEGDGKKEMVVEFYSRKKLEFATYLTSSKSNGVYDQVEVKGDIDGDGDFDARDKKLIRKLAEAAVAMLK